MRKQVGVYCRNTRNFVAERKKIPHTFLKEKKADHTQSDIECDLFKNTAVQMFNYTSTHSGQGRR